jgi:hypothetical protein
MIVDLRQSRHVTVLIIVIVISRAELQQRSTVFGLALHKELLELLVGHCDGA